MKKITTFFTLLLTTILLTLLSACGNNENKPAETETPNNPTDINQPVTPPNTETPQWSEGLVYSLNKDGESYCVIGLGDCVDNHVYVPPVYKGLPVTELSRFNLIKNTRFHLHLPDSIKKITGAAFADTNGIVALTFGENLTEISEFAFNSSSSVPSIYYTGTFEQWCKIQTVRYNPVTSQISKTIGWRGGKNLHIQGTLVEELTIPESITEIQGVSYFCCTELKKLIIPAHVTKIDFAALTEMGEPIFQEIYFQDTEGLWELEYKEYVYNYELGDYERILKRIDVEQSDLNVDKISYFMENLISPVLYKKAPSQSA